MPKITTEKVPYIDVPHQKTGSTKCTYVLRQNRHFNFHLAGYPQHNVLINGQSTHSGNCMWCYLKYMYRKAEGGQLDYCKVFRRTYTVCSYCPMLAHNSKICYLCKYFLTYSITKNNIHKV